MMPDRNSFRLTVVLVVIVIASTSAAVERGQMLSNATDYEQHQWVMEPENLIADCAPPGEWSCTVCELGDHVGLPYCWGGDVTLDEFDDHLANDYAAGSAASGNFPDCTTGVDCSGYVSRLWELPWHYSTSTIPDISDAIDSTNMHPGDVYNAAGSHVIMWVGKDESGEAVITESGYLCMGVCQAVVGWSHFTGYTPRRAPSDYVETATVGTYEGTVDDPILIENLPFRDWRNTNEATGDDFDFYSAAPDMDESGPEYIYEIELTESGTLTAHVLDAPGADIDLHLLASLDADDCLARAHIDLEHSIEEAGTYYIVADSFVGTDTTVYSGAYVLDVSFEAGGEDAGPDADTDVDSDSDSDADDDQDDPDDTKSDGCDCNMDSRTGSVSILGILF